MDSLSPNASQAPFEPYTLYTADGSGGDAVEATLKIIGAPYEKVEIATWESEANRGRMAAINPMRQIPALILPGGEVLTESAAILIWLADRHPDAQLAPAVHDPKRGQFLRWMSFISASIYSLYWVRDVPSRLAADTAGETAILERTNERIAECWRIMDRQVTPAPYILGERLSVLDLYVACVSRWSPGRERFAKEAPKMAAMTPIIVDEYIYTN